MTPRDLFTICRKAGIVLSLADGRVRFKAPSGALTPDLRASLQEHKSVITEVLWRLDGMRSWQPGGALPVPIATPGQTGGPGQCHSCGVTFDDAERYGRCDACCLAFDEWMEEQAQRAEGAYFEV
jgi:hypothetical protein